VSANLETLNAAVESGAELVLVHHGLLWESSCRPCRRQWRPGCQALLVADATLAAYHLPDAHRGRQQRLLRELRSLEADRRRSGQAKGSASAPSEPRLSRWGRPS
jgi:putative NIF3 family GTP cyclohydrolase 1 type 2